MTSLISRSFEYILQYYYLASYEQKQFPYSSIYRDRRVIVTDGMFRPPSRLLFRVTTKF